MAPRPKPKPARKRAQRTNGAEVDTPLAPVTALPTDGVLDLDEVAVTFRVKLGGQHFDVVEPSIADNKRIVMEMPRVRPDADGAFDPEQAVESLNSMYQQVSNVLRHASGNRKGRPPTREFVEKHLKPSGFVRLMDAIGEAGEKGNAA